MSIKKIASAIARSISHCEIVHVDLSDLLRGLVQEAIEASDDETSEMAAACLAEIDGDADEDSDDGVPQAERVRKLCRQLIDNAQEDHRSTDDVQNGDVWEMWGDTEDGDDYRVHIRTER